MKIMTIALTAALAALPNFCQANGKSIYGPDNRQDVHELSDSMKALGDSVVALWSANRMTILAEEPAVQLSTRSLRLCPGEKFQDQRAGAFCSGALVGEDLVMTAGHCLLDGVINTSIGETCANMRFVFGFAVTSEGGSAPDRINSSEVYSCQSAVLHSLDNTTNSDYALIKLDRKVTGHKALKVNRSGEPALGTKLFVMGYPSGLPLKMAGDATVRSTGTPTYFVTNLDTFHSNSGSPVFNETTGLIEGILVRGDNDYNTSPAGCRTVATYAMDGGRGEDVSKLSPLLSSIPGILSDHDRAVIRMINSSPIHRRMMQMAPIDDRYAVPW